MNRYRILVAAAAALVIGSTAFAQVTTTRYRAVYYSNSQMSEEVGYVIITCDHTSYGNGYLTPYYTEEWWDC